MARGTMEVKQWMYGFEGGGWNTEWAKTRKGAIAAAKRRWKGDPKLVPNVRSFHLATDEGLRSALSLFN